MAIDLPKSLQNDAVASIERYFLENMDEKIGNLAASGLLGFFLEEIGPLIYNKAVNDVQQHMNARVADLDIDVHEEAFQYWSKREKPAGKRSKR